MPSRNVEEAFGGVQVAQEIARKKIARKYDL
jgi:hypothetical protein